MPTKMNSKKPTLRYTVIKLSKVQRQRGNLESSKGTASHHVQGNTHKIISNFSSELLQARKEWADIFKALGKKTANQDTVSGKTALQK